ncbi:MULTISPECIES: radical SAM peptide maturase, CXXX-repeat target family [Clostridium]|uniref:Radical SAM peptide maturase, CXXX-repeat target family n=1 Tax=Clostridium cibarium TaxID=2762247 RepID=A0ABR8PSA9_9CLOT|nr:MULTISPECIES: radical SAM peptide maturase, CXXX-repeat target family [Clostridium]MBD7911033.1 radical SAM peptide maturase, CXXX-repeat target family [Clostridium cibarium]
MNSKSKVMMGEMRESWKESLAKTITFSVTEECNLACKYCYMTGKNTKNKMSFETAKKTVDYILQNREIFDEEAVVWEFVGGEPFLEIDLIDQITDYIKFQMYILDHPWFNSFRFNFSSNGILYDTPAVQKYIKKNRGHLSIGLSVDGNKIKHDMQRVNLHGDGSYDNVMKNVPLWLKQFPGSVTKSTFAHEDLLYLKDSIISLWENGIKTVTANVVFEDVWHEGDDLIFENQLKELADYILEKDLWREYSVRFFSPSIGFPLRKEDLKKNYCGAGKMLAIDYQGRFFPCLRFLDFTLNNHKGLCIGDMDNGINQDMIRPFQALNLESQSKEECVNCEVASGCAWCTGFDYDAADTDTIYQRATFNCKMHKANVRACEYFWNKFEKVTGIVSPRKRYRESMKETYEEDSNAAYMQIITSDDITPHCTYRNWRNTSNVMDKQMFDEGLKFCEKNNFTPVILGTLKDESTEWINIVDGKANKISENTIVICDNNTKIPTGFEGNCILLISRANIDKLNEFVRKIYPAVSRINVVLENIDKWVTCDIDVYREQLDNLKSFVIDTYKNENPLEINVLTDRLDLNDMCNCDAGENTFTLAPNGKIYICAAFYFNNPDDYIGDLVNGIHIKNNYLLELKNAPICSSCDAYHCRRCKYLNKKLTGEINTPSKIQCVISNIERNKSRELQLELNKQKIISSEEIIGPIDYIDPLDKLLNNVRSVEGV